MSSINFVDIPNPDFNFGNSHTIHQAILDNLRQLTDAVNDDNDISSDLARKQFVLNKINRLKTYDNSIANGNQFTNRNDFEGGEIHLKNNNLYCDVNSGIVANGAIYLTSSGTIETPNSVLSVGEIDNLNGTTSNIQTQINSKAPINNPTFTGTIGGITKSMVGLGNVDNTTDLNKPISTATQNELNLKANISYVDTKISDLVGTAPDLLNTIQEISASLNNDPSAFNTLTNSISLKAPINNPTFTGTISGISKSMVGLGNVDNTTDLEKPISTATQSALDLKAPLNNPTFTGTIGGINKSMVGLGNVDNTTDLNKPISTLTQLALDLKAPIDNPTFTGTIGGITKSMVGLGNVDNTTDLDKPISTLTQIAIDLKAPIDNPIFTGLVSGITKSMVGLGNVDNTTDLNKPISTATQSALDLKANISYVDTQISNLVGSAPSLLDTLNELSSALGDDPNFATTISNSLSLKAPINNPTFTGTIGGITKSMVGLSNVDNTTDLDKPISTATQSALDLKAPINNPTFTGTIGGITKSMVGLGNVDNTTDLDKPISTTTQSALDLKAPLNNPTFTGTISGISKSMVGLSNVENTNDLDKPISTATQSALDLKAPINNPTFTGTIGGINKSMVGLGNVDNTTDLNKPISTLTQSALDLKAPIDNPTFTGTIGGITKSMVGLGNVDNTTDLDKPISTATQSALDLKAPINNPTFTGTISGITKSMVGLSNVDNTTDLDKPISTATQSALDLKANISYVDTQINNLVGGAPTLLDSLNEIAQSLNNDPNISTTITNGLALKAPINNPTFTGTIGGITKSMVGLGNVDNTTDLNKPISTLTQSALDLKQNIIGDGDLTISKTSGLQTALNTLQTNIDNMSTPTIADGSITDAKLASTFLKVGDIAGKQNTITPLTNIELNDLTIDGNLYLGAGKISDSMLSSTFLKAGDIAGKQNTITSSTDFTMRDLTCNSLNGISSTSLSYLDATSSIQTQLNSKLSTISDGSITDIKLASTFVKPSTAPILTGSNFTGIPQSAITNLTTDLSGKQATLTNGSISDSLLASTFVKPSTAPILTGSNFTGIPQSAITNLTTDLSGKQATLTTSSDLSVRSLITSGNSTMGSISEKFTSIGNNGTLNSYTLDYTGQTSVYILSTAPTANMTIRLNNCGTDLNKNISFSIIYNTTGKYYGNTITCYSDTATQITLASSTPLFSNGTPSISTSTILIQTFTLIRNFTSNYVLSSVVSYY